MTTAPANSRQVGGTHYNRGTSPQHWDVVVAAMEARYLEGCITKYVSRHRDKGGRQDLEKSVHYMDKLLELVAAGKYRRPLAGVPRTRQASEMLRDWVGVKHTREEQEILHSIVEWASMKDLEFAKRKIQLLIEKIL